MPHFDHAGPFKVLVNALRKGMKDTEHMLGIDENTAMVGKLGGPWQVMGESKVHLLMRKSTSVFETGETVPLQ